MIEDTLPILRFKYDSSDTLCRIYQSGPMPNSISIGPEEIIYYNLIRIFLNLKQSSYKPAISDADKARS